VRSSRHPAPLFDLNLFRIRSYRVALVGSLLFVAMREIVQRFTENWMLAFGIVLLVIIMGFRGGVVGALESLWRARPAERKGR